MGKKRHRPKPGASEIPDVITANIGSTIRQEIESTPEVFESVHQSSDSTATDGSSSSDVAFVSSSKSTVKKKKPKPKVRRQIRITKENKIHPFAVENLRIFSGSSGTHSYDSSRSARSLTRDLPRCKYIASSPLDTAKAEYMITNPLVAIRPLLFRSYSQPAFCNLVHGEQQPKFGDFTPAAIDEQNKQLIKEAVANALTEFLTTGRDDVRLTIRVRRKRAQPVMEMKLAKKEGAGRQRQGAKQSLSPLLAVASSSSSLCCLHRNSTVAFSEYDNYEDVDDDSEAPDTKTAVEPAGVATLAERCLALGRSVYASLLGFWIR